MAAGSQVSPFLLPSIAFVASAIASHLLGIGITATDPAMLVSIGGTIASVGATMLGFLLAVLAVLASISHTHLVSMMRRSGHYDDLLYTVFYGCAGFFICLSIGIALTFGLCPPNWLRTLVVAVHVAAFVSLMDVGRKFWLVLANLREN